MRDHSYSLHSLAATFVLPCYFTFYPHCVGNSEKGWERGRNPSPCSQFIIHSKFLWKPLTLNNKFPSSPSAPCLWGHSTNRFPVIMEGEKKKKLIIPIWKLQNDLGKNFRGHPGGLLVLLDWIPPLLFLRGIAQSFPQCFLWRCSWRIWLLGFSM